LSWFHQWFIVLSSRFSYSADRHNETIPLTFGTRPRLVSFWRRRRKSLTRTARSSGEIDRQVPRVMTRAEEINVKIVYEIPDTRDPRLIRSRDPLTILLLRLHSRKLHISQALPSSSSRPAARSFSTTIQRPWPVSTLLVIFASRFGKLPPRETMALHGATWLAHLWPQHPACRLREEVCRAFNRNRRRSPSYPSRGSLQLKPV